MKCVRDSFSKLIFNVYRNDINVKLTLVFAKYYKSSALESYTKSKSIIRPDI